MSFVCVKEVTGQQETGEDKSWNTWLNTNSVSTVLAVFASGLSLCQRALPLCQYICNLGAICKKLATSYSPSFSQVEGCLIFSIPAFSKFSIILCLLVTFPCMS